ncbi:glycosyltransferase [Denitrobaculum tricleocarpae]|uniref:Glycosyltransferase family 1 protein n=1 Tax=Denitrobaculum tricleocarpae TaxID=2591009 RepID=A0A545U351_9PROT|nr:glycosyltransferase [Denitrobaculum tricleocarpae]TQV83843.1 glycosyltransferase family 1 protein [Denitrobaculum tricleocarpae]
MKILIFTMGSRGDVQPYLALGRALLDRGHEVTLSCSRDFDEMIETAGLTPAPLSIDIRALLESPEIQEALAGFTAKIRAWRQFRPLMRRLLDETWEVAREAKPDLLIYHPKSGAAQHIAEALRIPAIPTTLQPGFVETREFPQFLLPGMKLGDFANQLSHRAFGWLTYWSQAGFQKRWREQTLGLSTPYPRDFFAGYDPAGRILPRLHGYSRNIQPRPADWDAREEITGYWFSSAEQDWAAPEDLTRFLDLGPPPVYIGFGSMPSSDVERTTQAVTGALELCGRRGILATGWGGLGDLGESRDIHVLERAPHSWLFPRCSAVVHHGGAGTTHEGLRWGRPSVLCPLGVDQPYWGHRVQVLGVGPAPVPQKRLTAENLARALEEAHNPSVIDRAEALGETIRAEQGAKGAAEVIERSLA